MEVSKLVSSKREIKYTYIDNDSKTICFMLSGSGYTYEKPLLYYLTMQIIEAGYDVVQVHYTYDPSHIKTINMDFINRVIEDVDSVVEDVIAKKKYEQIIFFGKSLGTLPITFKYGQSTYFKEAKLVLLTPLFQVEGSYEKIKVSTNNSLVVIGTEDGNYIKSNIEALRHNENMDLIEIAGANHSLEIVPVNMKESLKIIEKVMVEINNFILK